MKNNDNITILVPMSKHNVETMLTVALQHVLNLAKEQRRSTDLLLIKSFSEEIEKTTELIQKIKIVVKKI